MKAQVLQENLSNALIIANRFVSTRAQLPVLSNILLSSKKNKLNISSTNLESSISISIGAKTEKTGEITIPARVIVDLIANLNPGSINLDVEKERLSVSTSNFKSVVSGMNASDFPSIPQDVGKSAIKVKSDDLIGALNKVLFAASSDETRPVLTGVLLLVRKNSTLMVATDGFRLSQKKIDLKGKKDGKIIIPKNVLADLARLSGDVEEIDFSYGPDESQVIFGVGDSVLASRIIEGEFPDFEKIIPKSSVYKVDVDKEELLQAVKLASVFARDSANVVKLTIKKDSILVSAESKTAGSEKSTVDAKVEGPKDELEIAYNYRFLEELLNVVESEDVMMEFTNSNAPGKFIDSKDGDYLHLVMPVKIQS
jgi:DNA polymerase-3 subunit beta